MEERFFFLQKKLISPKNGASEKALFFKIDFSQKGASEEAIFFLKKET